jgi:hypothetical protein
MRRIEFDKPVKINFGRPRRSRTVSSVREAVHCLKSENWPAKSGPCRRMATKALGGVSSGHITPAEAREAFTDAALEAGILDARETVH